MHDQTNTQAAAGAGSVAIHSNTANFQQDVINSSKPVLVDFWAEWCTPCHMIAPELEKLAKENSDKIQLVKVDIEQSRDLAMTYRIMSIPNLMLFKDGQPTAQLVGARPKEAIVEWLKSKGVL